MATRDTGGQKQTTRRDDEVDETQTAPSEDVQERNEKLTDDVDAILDEIDEVLEVWKAVLHISHMNKGNELSYQNILHLMQELKKDVDELKGN